MEYARLVHELGERIKVGVNAYLKLEIGGGTELWGK